MCVHQGRVPLMAVMILRIYCGCFPGAYNVTSNLDSLFIEAAVKIRSWQNVSKRQDQPDLHSDHPNYHLINFKYHQNWEHDHASYAFASVASFQPKLFIFWHVFRAVFLFCCLFCSRSRGPAMCIERYSDQVGLRSMSCWLCCELVLLDSCTYSHNHNWLSDNPVNVF